MSDGLDHGITLLLIYRNRCFVESAILALEAHVDRCRYHYSIPNIVAYDEELAEVASD
jgi:hypothetical protein